MTDEAIMKTIITFIALCTLVAASKIARADPGDTFRPLRYRGTVEVAERPRGGRLPRKSVVPQQPVVIQSTEDGERHESRRWRIVLDALLKRQSRTGNLIFVLSDAAATGRLLDSCINLYQTDVRATRAVSADLELTGDDGFEPGHTYRLRILQLIRGKEVVLAESAIALL
jgi:hypothetical protein